MDFILTLEGEQGQSLLRFLQSLDFVRLRPAESPKPTPTENPTAPKTYPYFDACPNSTIRLRQNAPRHPHTPRRHPRTPLLQPRKHLTRPRRYLG